SRRGGVMIERHSRGVYVISVAAELAGVHPQTLRIYERKGLLDPARTAGGNRRYSESDLARLRHIAELTEEGLNLAGVRRVLELEAELDRLQAEVERARRGALDRVEGVATGALDFGLQPVELGFQLQHASHAGEVQAFLGELGDVPQPGEVGLAVAPVPAGGAGRVE